MMRSTHGSPAKKPMRAAAVAACMLTFYVALIAGCSRGEDAADGLAPDERPFISVWDTAVLTPGSSGPDQVALPLTKEGSYNFTVDWGDGNRDTITAWDQPGRIHTYGEEGVYRVAITGKIEGWSFGGHGDRGKIMEISSWGCLKPGDSGGYFCGSENLSVTAEDMPDLSGTGSMEDAFRNSGVSKIPGINRWDVSGVTVMSGMFRGASDFNQDLNGWDVSAVSDMSDMFRNAAAFNGDIGNWDVGNVEDASGMFLEAVSFNRDIGGWNVSGIKDMSYMFSYAGSFNCDIGEWDVGAAVDMEGMFAGAGVFSRDIGGWDVSRVENMKRMFRDAHAFNCDIGGWDVSSVSDMERMFRNAASFNQDLGEWNVSGVKKMNRMFRAAALFNGDIESWDVGSVYNMEEMFRDAHSFNRDIGGWDVGSVRNMRRMFRNADSFDRDIGRWDVSGVEDMEEMFAGTGLSNENYDSLLKGWAGLPSLVEGVVFHAGSSTYDEGAEARKRLKNDHSWQITDGGRR